MPTPYSVNTLSHESFSDKISNHAQIGGIETSVIDDGYGRGTRIAWINTGTGLRYKVVIDRAMDIADAFYNHHSLAWLSSSGIMPPQPFADKGTDWLQTFGGGLLTTCGLSHVGGPEEDNNGHRGLHGRISNCPAELESVIQPDPLRGRNDMSISGIIKEAKIFGPYFELKRKISGRLGEPFIQIHDEVTNRGNASFPHMLLYHINFGWPLADTGAELVWKGKMVTVPEGASREIFNDTNDFKRCPPPMKSHLGSGEAVAFFDVAEDEEGNCFCGICNKQINLGVSISFKKKELPWLTNWQHWSPGEYVTGIEPGTNPPIGQTRAREEGQLIFLEPGETRSYTVTLSILEKENDILDFLKNK